MNSHPVTADEPPVVEVDSSEDSATIFDRVCRREIGVSGADFLVQWDAGNYDGVDVDDVEGLAEVVAALPFVR